MQINLANDPLRKLTLLTNQKNVRKRVINLFGALSDKRIYYRKKSKVSGSAYLKGVKGEIQKHIKDIEYKGVLKIYNHYLRLNTPLTNFKIRVNKWMNNDRVPLEFIRILSLYLFNDIHKEKKFLLKIFNQIRYITDRTGSSRFRPPILIKEILNRKRIYDIGSSMGDGGLFSHQQSISDGSVNGKDLNLTKKYLKELRGLKIKIWGLSKKSIRVILGKKENKNMYNLVVSNKSYIKYLNFVYGLPIGDKIRQGLKEPVILNLVNKKQRNSLKRLLYRGLFDSDGSYAQDSSTAKFWSKSNILIEEAKKFLTSYRIGFTYTKNEINISAESYKRFLEIIGSSHERKLKTIKKRISISPKSYYLKGINKKRMIGNRFNFENTNFYVSNINKLFKEFREKLGITQIEYCRRFNISKITLRYWEYGLNQLPIRELYRIIKLNGENANKVISKRLQYIRIKEIKLPLKINKDLLEIIKYIIPQKSFNNACVIKREGTRLNKKEIYMLKRKIECYFECKIKVSEYTSALYIHNRAITSFLNTFFIYRKSWSKMSHIQFKRYYNRMKGLMEEDMEGKLPFEQEEKKVVVKKEASTNLEWGCKPEERPVEKLIQYGIVNLNKPAGPR